MRGCGAAFCTTGACETTTGAVTTAAAAAGGGGGGSAAAAGAAAAPPPTNVAAAGAAVFFFHGFVLGRGASTKFLLSNIFALGRSTLAAWPLPSPSAFALAGPSFLSAEPFLSPSVSTLF